MDEATKANADIKTLERLVAQMTRDVSNGAGLSSSAVLSICSIIEDAIGAPINWPSRAAGAAAADKYYRGDNALRHAFNAGVKWAVEAYQPTVEPTRRFDDASPASPAHIHTGDYLRAKRLLRNE